MRQDSKIALCEPEDNLAQGWSRSQSSDGDLLSLFDVWPADVDPLNRGELSAEDSDRLLRRLKSREVIFEAQLALMPPPQAERFRRRYRLLIEFLKSAIDHNEPIYLLQ